jgi:hypothetical protein
MNTTLKQQIEAIQRAMEILKAISSIAYTDTISELNDAGSSLAALNLNPDREKRIKELEEALGPFKKLADSCWANERSRPDDTLFQFNETIITFRHLTIIQSLLTPNQ